MHIFSKRENFLHLFSLFLVNKHYVFSAGCTPLNRRKNTKIQETTITSDMRTDTEEKTSTPEQQCGSNGTFSESKSSQNNFKCAYSDVKIPKIDTSTAYILFYERSGLDYEPYMPKVVSNEQTNVPEVELEENESELRKQLCSVQ